MKKSLLESFLVIFQTLTYLEQKIWRYLQSLSKKLIHVFPSQSTIAEKCGCHRSTANQILKKFSELGWITYIRRCFRSNEYYMPDELIDIDLNDPVTFTRENLKTTREATREATKEATKEATLYNVNNVPSLRDVRLTSKPCHGNVQSSKDQKHRLLEELGFFGKDLWCLARYHYNAIIYAREDLKSRESKEPINKLVAWFTSRCKVHNRKFA